MTKAQQSIAVQEAVQHLFERADGAGITTLKLASLSGISRVSLSYWRNGHVTPNLGGYLRVMAALDKAMA
tara:strand:+ start:2981 stop:3190 length:210 start_codon:yes stop_codon:yes gene_type:complete